MILKHAQPYGEGIFVFMLFVVKKFGGFGISLYLCSMNAMDWLYVIIFVAVVVTIVLVARQWLKRRNDYALLCERVHLRNDRYTFLIDRKFRVKDTNFYELNEDIQDDQPYVLGNVLHCQTAIDEGLCGTGIDCDTCPIRVVIKNAFKLKRDFSRIEAVMRVRGKYHKIEQMDVIVDGELVYVGKEPYFLVKVRKNNKQA